MKKYLLFATWYLLIAVTIVAAIYGGLLLWERFRPARFEELGSVAVIEASGEVVEPVTVTFPKFGISVQVMKGEVRNDQWSIPEDSAGMVTMETESGEGWIIYGHNYPRILGKLDGMNVGEMVEMTLSDGSVVKFEISEKKLVYPEYTDSIIPSDSEPLVIYTCTGFLDSKRLVVRAKPVE